MSDKSMYSKRAKWMPLLMVPLFLLGLYMIYQRLAYENRDFYEEYFQLYPIASSLENRPELDEGLSAFRKGDFPLAESLLSAAYEREPDPEVGIQWAMSRMSQGKYWEAIDVLQRVKEESPSHLQVVEWYKTLALIGLERKDEVMHMLIYYSEQPEFEYNKKEVQELLDTY